MGKRKAESYRNPLAMKEEVLAIFADGRKITIYDTETTGVGKNAKIIQFAGVQFHISYKEGVYKVTPVDEFNIYINPEEKLAPKITEITGLTDKLLEGMPKEHDAVCHIGCFMAKTAIWGAYNEAFDNRMFNGLLTRTNRSLTPKYRFDVLKMVRDAVPKSTVENFKLGTIVEHLFPDAEFTFHEALDDVRATGKVLEYALQFYADYEYNTSDKMEAKLEYASAFLNPRSPMQQRIRLALNVGEVGDIFWDVIGKCWNCKKTTFAKGIFAEINMLNLEKQVLEKYKSHGDNMEDIAKSLVSIKKKKAEAKAS